MVSDRATPTSDSGAANEAVTPELIHRTFILARIASARDYLDMAHAAYRQDYPDAVVMALELAGSEAAEARQRVVTEDEDKDKDDG